MWLCLELKAVPKLSMDLMHTLLLLMSIAVGLSRLQCIMNWPIRLGSCAMRYLA